MIYLDNHATTACDPQVLAAMMPFFTESYGNASSPHELGQAAAAAVSIAQAQVATLVGGELEEIVFTSGATESNNLALLGVARQHEQRGGARRRLVTTAIEHKSVLAPLEYLAGLGWDLVYLPVDETGRVDLHKAQELITEETLLVSVQAANSEIGTIQPLAELAELAHARGALMHCDASQAAGKIALNVTQLQVDLLSLSGHKMYGPKGIGVLWVRGGSRRLPLTPLMYGGGHAGGLRSGTLPVPLIVGLGVASELAVEQLLAESQRTAALRDEFEQFLVEELRIVIVNGAVKQRLPNNTSLTFAGLDAEALLANLPELVASTGAACESGSVEPSRVLLALGLTQEQAFGTIRFGLGRFTTAQEIRKAASQIITAYRQLALLLA
ncbi:cysteine desulfurase family protein [Hymenobacter elongatus]|uniref:cysteine desulfurase n=1 Tax=Hymenobacter elongatus TaxID=877208 RepID=A0A4Z0PIT2_9BACT|nr:cysteine desulfurase family protein [Hymenobacter elongatus]TGE15017.1 cysteine desulfurase [Hymenobacter elongatus]